MAPIGPDGQQARQGWIQTGLIVVTTIVTITLGYARLDAKANEAIGIATSAKGTAATAETHASNVETMSQSMSVELMRIRTILDERLPKKLDK